MNKNDTKADSFAADKGSEDLSESSRPLIHPSL
jgi:hypothetical protein